MIRPYARAAFANGWAEVAAFTEAEIDASAGAFLEQALRIAERDTDRPEVLHSTRIRGRVAALWHTIEKRRVALDDRYRSRLQTLLPQLLALTQHRIRQALFPATEAQDTPDRDAIIAAIEQILGAALDGSDLGDDFDRLMSAALLDATAEGRADGAGYLAAAQGGVVPDFDVEFGNAIVALRNLSGDWTDPSTWVGKQVHGLAYQLGNRLADAIASGEDWRTLLGIVQDTIVDPTGYVDLVLEHAIATAAIDGALALYQSEGLAQVNVLVSPNACDICEPLPLDNPYDLNDAPDIPEHPRCRCAIVPAV